MSDYIYHIEILYILPYKVSLYSDISAMGYRISSKMDDMGITKCPFRVD
jgi:hypothetical protein